MYPKGIVDVKYNSVIVYSLSCGSKNYFIHSIELFSFMFTHNQTWHSSKSKICELRWKRRFSVNNDLYLACFSNKAIMTSGNLRYRAKAVLTTFMVLFFFFFYSHCSPSTFIVCKKSSINIPQSVSFCAPQKKENHKASNDMR